MKKIILLICFAIGLSGYAQNIEFKVHFDSDSFTLSTSDAALIQQALQKLPCPPESCQVKVVGHTDDMGSLEYNKVLSLNRAKAISGFLQSKGFRKEQISISGKAYTEPVTTNDDDSGKSENRRVTVFISPEFKQANHIGGLMLKEDVYHINAAKAETLKYKSGSEIHIPANAFVDEDGKPISGNIDVRYVEYRDPIDFILGNIPMDYPQHGENTHFNSAGMYKILANQNGKSIYLREGTQITVDFAMTQEVPGLNFYNYDTIANKWTELSKITPQLPLQTATAFIRVDTAYSYYYGEDKGICSRIDNGARVKRVIETGRELAASTTSLYAEYLEELKQSNLQFARAQAKSDSLFNVKNKFHIIEGKAKIASLKKSIAKNESKVSQIDSQIKSITASYQPVKISEDGNELKFKINYDTKYNIQTINFDDVTWIYDAQDAEAVAPEVFDKKWDSCRIWVMDKKHFGIELKDSISQQLIQNLKMTNAKATKYSYPRIASEMNKGAGIQKSKVTKLTQLRNMLLKKNSEFTNLIASIEKKITQPKITYTANIQNLCFYEHSRPYMTADEQAMTAVEWLRFFDDNKEAMLQRYNTIDADYEYKQANIRYRQSLNMQQLANENAASLVRSMNISQLGIFNCDQISRLSSPLYVDAVYEDERGRTVKPLFIYLVDSRINGILRYDGNYGYSPSRFAYSPTSQNTLMAFDADDNSFVLNAADFRKTVDGKTGTVVFKLKKVSNIKNKEELISMF
ncbi:OmpA family protein [Flavobacterium sp.]|uniref:OmpA family protein n=1 Tax=Flavobacterium sp. TaxID=239 RepID=UPI00260554E7|nr:OmpA family protein [Flavobacterium sp.]